VLKSGSNKKEKERRIGGWVVGTHYHGKLIVSSHKRPFWTKNI
jgi:hypothetical protein